MTTSTEIRLTIERAAGSTNAQKRASLFTLWKAADDAITSGVRSLSVPGMNGAINGDALEDYRERLMLAIDYLDGLIGEDDTAATAEPMGHTVDFSQRPVIW